MPAPTTRRDWALALAARGWPVFPLLPGAKRPAWHGDSPERPCPRTGACRDGHQGWEQRASRDPAALARWWGQHPERNIGLATGPAGLLVVDLDVAKPGRPLPRDCATLGITHGARMLARLARADRATVPATWTVRTPSRGTHLVFRQPAGLAVPDQLRSTRGADPGGLAGLVDTRGWGGYVVAPGSSTPDGAYELIDDRAPVELPGWLHRRLAPPQTTTGRPVAGSVGRPVPTARERATGGSRGPGDRGHPPGPAAGRVAGYVAAAKAGEARRVATAPAGGHNRAQMIAGLALGQLVGAGQLEYDDALDCLMSAAAGHVTGPCGCTEHGVRAVFTWGLDRGATHPRHLPSRPTRLTPPG